MPKQVDHDRRRDEIVEAVWMLVEEGGFPAATMRDIATRAGYANGALTYYFPNKSAILAAAYRRAYDLTDERIRASVGDHEGIEALRRTCLELLPLDQERSTGARVVLAFWDHAVADADLAQILERATGRWIERIAEHVAQGRARGEIRTAMSDEAVVDEVVCVTMGLQVVPTLLGDRYGPARQVRLLDAVLDRLRTP